MKLIAKLTLLALLMPAVAGCVTGSPVVAAAGSCSNLLPSEWEKGVEGAEVPPPAAPQPQGLEARLAWTLEQLKAWTGFGVEESARREIANGRTRDSIGITRRCEERDRAAIQRAKPRVLGIF